MGEHDTVERILRRIDQHKRRLEDLEGIEIPFQVEVQDGLTAEGVRTLIEEQSPVGASAITFSEIPLDFKHLEVRWIAKSNENTSTVKHTVRINGFQSGYAMTQHKAQKSLGAESDAHFIEGFDSETELRIGEITGDQGGQDNFGWGIAHFPYYLEVMFKGVLASTGAFATGTPAVNNIGGFDMAGRLSNSGNINTLRFAIDLGTFKQGSKYSLYGLDD